MDMPALNLSRTMLRISRVAIGHPRLTRLLSDPYFGRLLESCPRLVKQYLSSHLARSFTLTSRMAAVDHHYRFLKQNLSNIDFTNLLYQGITLWQRKYEDQVFSIILKQNIDHFYEGDLVIALFRQNVLLFQISFSILPALLIGMPFKDIILAGGAQGASPERGELSFAVRANKGVAPAHLVIAALRGVASAFRQPYIAGVSNILQIKKTQKDQIPFSFSYDAFWSMFEAEKNAHDFFIFPTVPFRNEAQSKSSPHRRRSRKKAIFKNDISLAITQRLQTICEIS